MKQYNLFLPFPDCTLSMVQAEIYKISRTKRNGHRYWEEKGDIAEKLETVRIVDLRFEKL